MDVNYIPIRVSTLRGNLPIDFDAYVKINDKYILYVRKGDSFEGPRLQRLRAKKLQKMYITPAEEPQYRAYINRNADMAFSQGGDLANRVEIIQGIQQNNTEAVFEDPADADTYNKTKEDCERFVKFMMGEPDALSHMLKIENLDKSIAHHGVSVSSLATGLAQQLGTFDIKQQQMIALSALLHDIEHFNSAIEITRPRRTFTEAEEAYYKHHPTEGIQKLQALKHFDSQVIRIIAQHEEFMDGKGFPSGLSEKDLDPLALVVASANAIDRLINFEGVPRSEAAKQFTMQSLGKYPLDYIKILTELIKR